MIESILMWCVGTALCGFVPFSLGVASVVILANCARVLDGRGRRR